MKHVGIVLMLLGLSAAVYAQNSIEVQTNGDVKVGQNLATTGNVNVGQNLVIGTSPNSYNLHIGQDGSLEIQSGSTNKVVKINKGGTIDVPSTYVYTSGFDLPVKQVVNPGSFVDITLPLHLLPRTSHRIVLWVNVAGHADITQSTVVRVHKYIVGRGQPWVDDTTIGDWTIYGRDWADSYIDENVSKRTSVGDGFNWYGLMRITNNGSNTLEIFAVGIIGEGHDNCFVQE